MIEPFVPEQVRVVDANTPHERRVISYGLSSFGYDLRVAREFKIFTNVNSSIVDPKHFDPGAFVDFEGDVCIIPPNSFALARSVEYLRIPEDVVCITLGKSTYARCGIIVNITPAEPGWRGYLTIEISNTTPLPARIYAGEGIAQMLFFRGERPAVTYSSRQGKYQDQQGIVLPRV
ncbi:MAG: dCTP deaminase [Limnochordaceae bacterium]|nr:dCTP deaminase [Limnochordaceae bacterium]